MWLVLIPLALLVIGIYWALTEVHRIRQATASLKWPQVEGRVLSAGVHLGSASTRVRDEGADITYEYEVNGRTYKSRQLDFTGIFGASASRIAEALVRYEAGRKVTVRYDPTNPANAVLTSEIDWRAFLRIGVALAMIVGGLLLLRV